MLKVDIFAGYMIIEGASFLDALFMTVITLTTIGYNEHVPLSKTGMVFTMILAISGVGFFFYIFSIIGDIITTSTLEIFSGKRMEGQIAKLKDHCILCGFGRVGKHECGNSCHKEKNGRDAVQPRTLYPNSGWGHTYRVW
jgi:voltage-gated potassium channel